MAPGTDGEPPLGQEQGKTHARIHAADVSTADGVLSAVLVGPGVEANRAAALLETIGEAIERAGPRLRHVVLDLGGVVFLTSTAVGAVIEVSNLAGAQGATTILYRPSEEVADLFKRTRTQRLFSIATTAADLARLLAQRPGAPGDRRG